MTPAFVCNHTIYELARRMHAAQASGSLPFPGPGSMLTARSWSTPSARRLARAGALAADSGPLTAVPDTLGGAGVQFRPKNREQVAELLGMRVFDIDPDFPPEDWGPRKMWRPLSNIWLRKKLGMSPDRSFMSTAECSWARRLKSPSSHSRRVFAWPLFSGDR